MKKSILRFGIIVLLVMVIFYVHSIVEKNEKNSISQYEGKWKVTKQIAESMNAVSYFRPHHYLGRTVIIDKYYVEKSIWYWPFELEWIKDEFGESEAVVLPLHDEWVRYSIQLNDIKEIVKDEVQAIRYYKGTGERKYCPFYLIVLDDTHLLYQWIGGYYLLEPFQYCDANISSMNLEGNWEISYLDSYEAGYQGAFEDIEDVKKIYAGLHPELKELVGSDFQPENWLGKKIQISADYIDFSGDSYEIESIEKKKVFKEEFERDNQIHDELSLYDKEITVCTVRCNNAESFVFVLVNENKVIMHIEQGWFMLSRITE